MKFEYARCDICQKQTVAEFKQNSVDFCKKCWNREGEHIQKITIRQINEMRYGGNAKNRNKVSRW